MIFCHFSDISFVTRGSSSEAGVTEKTIITTCHPHRSFKLCL